MTVTPAAPAPRRRRRRTLLVAVALAALLVPASLLAVPQRPRLADRAPGALLDRAIERLELTPAQLEEIRDVLREHRAELDAEVDAVADARRGLFDAIHAATFDEADVRAASDAVAAAEAELAVTRATIVQEVRAVLTPEQQAEAQEMLADARAVAGAVVQALRQRLLARLG